MAEEHEEPLGEDEPLGDDEREALERDLVDVQVLREILGSKGIKGVVFYCPDCDEDHYLAWDLLAGNLKELLEAGESPVHEPAFEPDPNDYVSWDYARGFLDGYESYPEDRIEGPDICLYCGCQLGERPGDWVYCPYCGRDFAPINLLLTLRRQGWEFPRIAALFEECGFVFPTFDADDLPAMNVEPGAG